MLQVPPGPARGRDGGWCGMRSGEHRVRESQQATKQLVERNCWDLTECPNGIRGQRIYIRPTDMADLGTSAIRTPLKRPLSPAIAQLLNERLRRRLAAHDGEMAGLGPDGYAASPAGPAQVGVGGRHVVLLPHRSLPGLSLCFKGAENCGEGWTA
ncbi:hypothetical protein EJ06DRAFT_385471 [Trichodelitschia bisporula]|uniref:Uncharacterized protein n=1 Tax=Trichodelitschia bisporula TaxID=703511 RepID=A0A6G1HZP9_9PEZI|nr:hypothetical protein EJ06DRAFT_385471 [Trichodelitschia bisporula]